MPRDMSSGALRALARRGTPGDDGVVLVLTALALAVLFASAALAVDLGNLGQTAQNAQDAADSAAVSGAGLLRSSASLGQVVTEVERYVQDNYSAVSADGSSLGGASSSWDTCTSAPAGYVAPPDSYGNVQDCISFDTSNASTASVVSVEVPPRSVPSTFSGTLGSGPATVTAAATASLSPQSSPCALCVLSGSGTSLQTTGSSTLSVATESGGSAILVSSSADPAISAGGASSIVATGGAIGVVGTATGDVSPAPVTGVGATADPLSSLAAPIPGPQQSDPHVTGDRSVTIVPGTYASITVDSGTLALDPGTYVVTGAFVVRGDASVYSVGSGELPAGVTLYFTCGTASAPSPCAAPGQPGGSLDLAGGSGFGLDAPTTGALENVLVYYDRFDTSPLVIDGDSGFTSTGTVYAKSAALEMAGATVGLDSLVDVGSLSVSGGASVSITYVAAHNAGALAPALCTLEPASLANC